MGFDAKTAGTFVKAYAILFWIEAALLLLAALLFLVWGGLFAGTLAELLGTPGSLLASMVLVVGVMFILLALVKAWVGMALWRRRPWARVATLILCVLNALSLLTGPQMTLSALMGAFGIYLFGFDEAVKALFRQTVSEHKQ